MNDAGSTGSGSGHPEIAELEVDEGDVEPGTEAQCLDRCLPNGVRIVAGDLAELGGVGGVDPRPHLHPHRGGKAEGDPDDHTVALDTPQNRPGEHQRSRHTPPDSQNKRRRSSLWIGRHRTRRPSGQPGIIGSARSPRILLSDRRRSCTLVNVAERWFLKLDGIAGESTSDTHKSEIDIDSWSWGLSNTGTTSGGGGGGAGKASFQDFHFVSRISKASPALFLACASGSHIKEALLSGVRGSGKSKGTDFLKYKLRDVMVTSVVQGDAEETAPTEQFSLNFSKVEISYTQQSTSGKVQPPVTAGWDLKVNKKI